MINFQVIWCVMIDTAMTLEFPSVRSDGGLPVFTTLRASKDGPIVEVRQSEGGNARFKVFSGWTDPSTGKTLAANREGGTIPKGTWFIAKYYNAPPVIRRKAASDRVGALRGKALLDEVSHRSYWMALYRDDRDIGQPIDDETFVDGQRRSTVRAHRGTESLGCLTFEDTAQYLQFIGSMAKGQSVFINAAGQRVEKGTKGAIEVYGTLIVGDAVRAPKAQPSFLQRILEWF